MREKCGVEIINDDVYMATRFDDFCGTVVLKKRGGSDTEFVFDAVSDDLNCDHFLISGDFELFSIITLGENPC